MRDLEALIRRPRVRRAAGGHRSPGADLAADRARQAGDVAARRQLAQPAPDAARLVGAVAERRLEVDGDDQQAARLEDAAQLGEGRLVGRRADVFYHRHARDHVERGIGMGDARQVLLLVAHGAAVDRGHVGRRQLAHQGAVKSHAVTSQPRAASAWPNGVMPLPASSALPGPLPVRAIASSA